MRNPAAPVIGVLVLALLGACRGNVPPPLPARLVEPGPEVRAELRATVVSALHGADVLLADDALTEDSLLVIEHRPRRDDQGRLLMGRALEDPIRFQLVLERDTCVLVNLATGARWALQSATCAATQ